MLRQGLGKSLASLGIKLATAGLTYAMFVVLSRTMAPLDYGHFAFGLSLATLLAIGAGLGQQTAILRFWSEEKATGAPGSEVAALRAGGGLTLLAGIGMCLAVVVLAFGWGAITSGPWDYLYVMAAALLILPLAQAEFASSALRAQGSVWTALAPRDLIWRFTVPALVMVLASLGLGLSGVGALTLTAALLALALLVQLIWARRGGYRLEAGLAEIGPYWHKRGSPSRWFLAGGAVEAASTNMDTILVGLFVASASAGLYFNAFRTAGLMTLFTFALSLVVAPMVAQSFHAGDRARTQAVLTLSAWAGFAFSLAVFGVLALFGESILSLFGPQYGQAHGLMVILSIGLLFDAATGSARTLMMMTGHERAYVWLFGAVTVLGVLLQLAVLPLFGLLGAALVNAGTRIVSNVAIVWWCLGRIGLDPSLLGVLRLGRLEREAT